MKQKLYYVKIVMIDDLFIYQQLVWDYIIQDIVIGVIGLKKYRDYQETVDKIDGQDHYKIVGVKVSTKPLLLSRKDKIHQECK